MYKNAKSHCYFDISNPQNLKPQSIAWYVYKMVNMTEYSESRPYCIVDRQTCNCKVIIRQQIRTEYKVAFPHLYNSLPRSVRLSPYHSSKKCTSAPTIPTFSCSSLIHSSIPFPCADSHRKIHRSSCTKTLSLARMTLMTTSLSSLKIYSLASSIV